MTKKSQDLMWGGGTSTLLLSFEDGQAVVLDYEYDTEEIHRLLGGKRYYVSRSGNSGAGYVTRIPQEVGFIPVGLYRADVSPSGLDYDRSFIRAIRCEQGRDMWIYLPYASHSGVVADTPAVIVAKDTWSFNGCFVTFCLIEDLEEVIRQIVKCSSVEELSRKNTTNTLRRVFVDEYGNKVDVNVRLLDLCPRRRLKPWTFVAASGLLDRYSIERSMENPIQKPYGELGLATLPDGKVVNSCWIGGDMYATGVFEEDPCKRMIEPPAGTGWVATGEENILFRRQWREKNDPPCYEFLAWRWDEKGGVCVLRKRFVTPIQLALFRSEIINNLKKGLGLQE